ncbi:AsmA family protein [Phenylobacterium sp.]|uniref:AsmA family protein n=1 Tax=Phenylobacterium sp. TaxID=1871053 RepID=UPI002736DBC8|nr:AsmA family protein [Phenylobacterium sp.]MDP3855169.1 AsmA family protein [Phenylobacterium sp.]
MTDDPQTPPPPRMSRRRKALVWTGGILGVLLVATALFLILFDWNYLRGPISRFASMRTGREVAIEGDLNVKLWSLTPSATVGRIRIGNPKWAGAGQMARIERLHVQIQALDLLRGRVVLLKLELARPNLVLLRDRQGRTTWDFSNGRKKDEPLRLPPVRRFVIEDGRLKFTDAKRKIVLDATLDASETRSAANRGFVMAGKGSINAAPFLLNVTGGPLLNVDPDKPYPFDADIRAGATRVLAKGAIPKPFDLGQFAMNVTANGPDLADLYDLTGVTLPNTPPYRLSGRMARDGTVWKIARIGGRVGDTDLAGELSVDTGRDRPFMKADLRSKLLDFDDLATVFGGAPAVGKGETASPEQAAVARQMQAQHRLLPDATLKVDRIRAMDADVRYAAISVRDAMLPLRSASVHVKLDAGLLTADPVSFDLPQGRIGGAMRLNARNDTPVTSVDLRLSNARLEQLVPIKAGGTPLTGSFVGRIKLTGAGASVHRAAANADGEVLAVIPRGEIREAFAELLGINVAKGLGLLLAKDQGKTAVRCAVAHFQVKNGVMTANRIVFDTGPVLGTGRGTIDLETERMDFRIEGHPKEARLIRLTAPITIRGPITGPKVGVETNRIIAQGGFAALLATAAAPLAAILPFVDLGLAKDAACGALISDAGREGVPVKSAAKR